MQPRRAARRRRHVHAAATIAAADIAAAAIAAAAIAAAAVGAALGAAIAVAAAATRSRRVAAASRHISDADLGRVARRDATEEHLRGCRYIP